MKKTHIIFSFFFLTIHCFAQQKCFNHSDSLKELYIEVYEKKEFLESKLRHVHEKVKAGELTKNDSSNYADKIKNIEIGFNYSPNSIVFKRNIEGILKTGDGRVYQLVSKDELSGFLSCLDDDSNTHKKPLKRHLVYDVAHSVSSSYQLKNGNFIVMHSRHAGYLNKNTELVVYKIEENGVVQVIKTIRLSIS